MDTHQRSCGSRLAVGFALAAVVHIVCGSAPTSYLTVTEWTHVIGELTHVSVGPAGVFGIHRNKRVFYRVDTREKDGSQGDGPNWAPVLDDDGTHTSCFTSLDVGYNVVWAIDLNGDAFARLGIDSMNPIGCLWKAAPLPCKLSSISVTPRGHVWATDTAGGVWRRSGTTRNNVFGVLWERVDGDFQKISAGGAGVWGIHRTGQVCYRDLTYNDPDTAGRAWVCLSGRSFNDISVGIDKVWCVDSTQDVYLRNGLSKATVPGKEWVYVPGKMSQVDVWYGAVWGLGTKFGIPNVFARLTSSQLS